MKKNTKLTLIVAGLGLLAYYMYKKSKKATTVSYAGKVGDRVGFADGGYVKKGDMYNNNQRFGTAWIGDKKSMTGQSTFFTNQSQKVNY